MAYQPGEDSYPAHRMTQDVPRMPFSSPIGEEILSPTSPNIPHNSTRRRRKNTADDLTKGAGRSRSEKPSMPKSPKRRTSGGQEREHNKTRWPGLNVVTSFSKSPKLAPSGVDTHSQTHRRLPPQALNAQPGFAALSDIKAPTNKKGDRAFKTHNRSKSSLGTMKSDLELRNHTEGEKNRTNTPTRRTEGLGLQPFENPSAPDARASMHRKSGADFLKPSPTKLTELSPSDGPIVIGISVPSAKLAEHAISPDAGATPITSAVYKTDQSLPETPTIVVTPARYQGSWDFSVDDAKSRGRGRPQPSSSFYSPAIEPHEYSAEHGGNRSLSTSFDGRFRSKNAISTKSTENIDDIASRERPESNWTVFDEDDNQVDTHKERPYSGESRLRILNRSSLDTIATKHRSQGWWNYIVSPFITRSNTASFGGWATRPASPVPALPSPGPGVTKPRAQQISSHSPATPISVKDSEMAEKDRTGIWADLRRLEAERSKIDFPFDRTSETNSPLDSLRSLEKPHGSTPPEAHGGVGTALEYFNAWWHDQNSPNPYFECQNHVCIPLAHDGPFPAEESRSQLHMGSHHDGPVGGNTGATVHDFKQKPANRFSAAFSQVNSSRRRALSEATEIEDDDVTPVVREAHVAPAVRAGPPIAATSIPASDNEHKEPASRIALEPDATHLLATDLVSVPAQSSVTRPAATKAIANLDPAGISADAFHAVQASSPERRSTISSKTARGLPQRLPTDFPSRFETSPERFIAANPPHQVYPKHAPPPFSEPDPSTSIEEVNSQQAAWEKGSKNVNVPAHSTYIVNHYYDRSGPSSQRETVTLEDRETPLIMASTNWERQEKLMHRPREAKKRNQPKSRGCFKRDKRPMTKKKKRLLWGFAASLILIIILIVVLAMTLTRKGDDLEVQSQWLNITGFPPIPTGISTIVQPDVVREDSGCIQPATVWSCAVPKEEQESIAPNNHNQPNFRVEIRFRNGTSTNSTLTSAKSREKRLVRSESGPVFAASFIRRRYLHLRDTLQDSLFSPSPTPPSQEDQDFLGKTTDNNTAPFDGEDTPFFMSFIPASKLPAQRLMKRQAKPGKNNTDQFPDIAKAIPPPDTNSDGTAAAANLLPLPVAQPLRLFNRGLATEHYGFYTYFDRSIFLKSTVLLNDTGPAVGEIPADRDGGADKSAATVRCTWRQTRFLVQIWTNAGAAAPLLGSSSNETSSKSKEKDHNPKNLTSSSANNFVRPGSFPYPVSITLDRHGGSLADKFIFCYGIDSRGRVILEKKKIQLEDRAFGGKLVNPVLAFKSVKVGKKEGGPGGIDGGSGGCGCQWRNWAGAFGGNIG